LQVRVPAQVPVAQPPFISDRLYNGTDTTANVLARWTHVINSDSDFSLQVYYDYLAIGETIDESNTNTADIDFHDRFMVGSRNEVTWGLGYRVQRTDFIPTAFAVISPEVRTNSIYSGFLQDTFAVVPKKLFVTLGSKFEHNDFTGFQIQPSGRLLWTPDTKNSVWAAVSRGVSTPNRTEEDLHYTEARFQVPNGMGGFTPAEAVLEGNRNFKSQALVAYELGYRAQLTSRLSIDVSGFYNNYTQLKTANPQSPQPGSTIIFPNVFGNSIAGDTYGGEISANVQITSNWRVSGSYSLLESTFENSQALPSDTSAQALSGSSPQNQAQIHSYLDITKRLHFNAGVYFTGKVQEFNVPAYISTDLNVAWEPRDGLELTVGVTNLFDPNHLEYGVTGNQGLSEEVPRTFYAQVSYRF
jgi:iron complex outermembrane recepter protein